MHQSLPHSSMLSPHVQFSWKAHSANISLHERELFITWKFPNIQYYSKHVLVTYTGKMRFHTQNLINDIGIHN